MALAPFTQKPQWRCWFGVFLSLDFLIGISGPRESGRWATVARGDTRLGSARQLKRDVLDADLVGALHGLSREGGRRGSRGRHGLAGVIALALRRTIEHDHVFGDDFRAVPFLAILPLPLAGLDAAVNVDFTALAEILSADVGQLAPGDDVVKLRLFLFLAGGIRPAVVGGDAEVGDVLPARGGPDFRIAGQVSDDHGAIEVHNPLVINECADVVGRRADGLIIALPRSKSGRASCPVLP